MAQTHDKRILTINSGSSSLRIQLFCMGESETRELSGSIGHANIEIVNPARISVLLLRTSSLIKRVAAIDHRIAGLQQLRKSSDGFLRRAAVAPSFTSASMFSA